MSIKSKLICSLALGGVLLVGCKKEEPTPKAQPKTPPTTMPTTKPSGPTTAPSTGGGGAAKPSGDPTAVAGAGSSTGTPGGSGTAQTAGDTVPASLPKLSPATRPIDLSSLGGPAATNPSQPVLNK